MSHVRMCDKCGTIFSEKRAGWETFTVSRQTTNQYGQPVSTSEEFDSCPECSHRPTVQPVIKAIEPVEYAPGHLPVNPECANCGMELDGSWGRRPDQQRIHYPECPPSDEPPKEMDAVSAYPNKVRLNAEYGKTRTE